MEAEEKRFWVGITTFATLFGIGGYVVFEHPFWGWLAMVAGLGGLFLGIFETGTIRLSGASWIIAILATWAILGYDIYDRHHARPATTLDRNDADKQIRQWLALWPWFSVKTLPNDDKVYFRLEITAHDARKIFVVRPRRLGDHLTMGSGTLTLSFEEQAAVEKLSPTNKGGLIHDLRSEMARIRMPYANIGLPLKTFELGRNLQIDGLTMQSFLENLNETDEAIILCYETMGRYVDIPQANTHRAP